MRKKTDVPENGGEEDLHQHFPVDDHPASSAGKDRGRASVSNQITAYLIISTIRDLEYIYRLLRFHHCWGAENSTWFVSKIFRKLIPRGTKLASTANQVTARPREQLEW
jgi:hypothetical protein